MEHLPYPDGAIGVDVPYLGAQEYDNGEFATFPERHGWNKENIFAGDFTRKTSRDLEAFLQSWLYFGP